jgi:hypothetical protein
MKSPSHRPYPPVSAHPTGRGADDLAHISRPNDDSLFYAACSRDYAEDPCGCPICRQTAYGGD